MSGKHTPGPWMAAACPSSVVGWPVVGPMGRSIGNVSWMPKKAFPDVSEADYAAFNAECEANARLIAAAPDLLAALKAAVSHIEHMGIWIAERQSGYSFESIGEDMPDMRAAIAKAEGRAP